MGVVRERSGNKSPAFQPYDVYRAKDGSVVIAAPVASIFAKLSGILGLDPLSERWISARTEINEIQGLEFDAILRGWAEERPMDELIDKLNSVGVPCCPIMSSSLAAEDAHYRARGVHMEWEDEQVGRLKGTRPVPVFSKTPTKIWRGTTAPGADNARVYGELLGKTAEQLAKLRAQGAI